MSGKRNPGTTQYEVWITREASDAANRAALGRGMTRGEYMQDAIWQAIARSTDRERADLLPTPRRTNIRYQWHSDPKPGYKGRWSMWVRIRCTVANPVPMTLTRTAEERGFGSASALVRHHLAIAIKADTGLTVPMPPGRTSENLFGGQINEAVR